MIIIEISQLSLVVFQWTIAICFEILTIWNLAKCLIANKVCIVSKRSKCFECDIFPPIGFMAPEVNFDRLDNRNFQNFMAQNFITVLFLEKMSVHGHEPPLFNSHKARRGSDFQRNFLIDVSTCSALTRSNNNECSGPESSVISSKLKSHWIDYWNTPSKFENLVDWFNYSIEKAIAS